MNSRQRRKATRAFKRLYSSTLQQFGKLLSLDKGKTPLMEFLEENSRVVANTESRWKTTAA